MISNERTWPSQRRDFNRPAYYQRPARPQQPQQPRPFVQEDTLQSTALQIERKQFSLTLKENPRGRYLRISEEASGRRNSIIIPATGLAEFQKMLEEFAIACGEPAPVPPPPGA